jgi:hypothetical protein
VEFNGAITDHAAWCGLLPNLCEAGKFFTLEG